MPWELDNDRPIYLQLMERIHGAERTFALPADQRAIYYGG